METSMKQKILAVDDSKMMLRIISSTIEMLGYETIKASNGKEALSILEQEPNIVLVLLDWNMPELDGMETLKAIKSNEQLKSLPVMMVTTEGEKRSVVKAIQAGAKHYLTKPFNQQDLATRIMECLDSGLI
jgi:two-component system, chemotaxis family, chemotaxis protein CheY